jgi:hypothetical protein
LPDMVDLSKSHHHCHRLPRKDPKRGRGASEARNGKHQVSREHQSLGHILEVRSDCLPVPVGAAEKVVDSQSLWVIVVVDSVLLTDGKKPPVMLDVPRTCACTSVVPLNGWGSVVALHIPLKAIAASIYPRPILFHF